MSTRSRVGLAGLSRNSVFVFGRTAGAPGVEVAAIDEGRFDAESRQEFLDDVAAGAEEGTGGKHVVARFQLSDERRRDRGHAGRRRPRSLRALEGRHAGLEHRHGRVREAGVDEAGLVPREAAFAFLGAGIDMALRQEERLGGLAELGAQRPAVDEKGLRAERRCRVLGHSEGEPIPLKARMGDRACCGVMAMINTSSSHAPDAEQLCDPGPDGKRRPALCCTAIDRGKRPRLFRRYRCPRQVFS